MVCSNTPEEEMNFITYLVITFNKRAKTGWLAEKVVRQVRNDDGR
jgi:hypothetical protein